VGSKIGLILSFLFVISVFFLGADLINTQIIYTNLDAVAMTAGHLIVENGGINEEISFFVERYANATITCTNNCTPRFGDTYIYTVATSYQPVIMSSEPLVISITRGVVIGFYN
jgi:hypothetical protein